MKMMKRLIILLIFFSYGIAAQGMQDTTEYLQPTLSQMKESRLVVQILDYFHYRDVPLNDSLSSVIFENYLAALDGNKNYFLASDIASFEKYRYQLDDDLKSGNLVPVYYIFNIYRKRLINRLEYALAKSKTNFNFDKKENFIIDREKADYSASEEAMDELWRKLLKSQALNLKLSGSDDEKIASVLTERYERFQSNVEKYNNNDVFQIFMNSVTEGFDPHTNYFTPLNADDFKMASSKSLEGIGATLQQDTDFTKIVELKAGGPAFMVGQINKDDRVVGVAQGADGEMVNVVGWRSDEVAGMIRGAKGTLVRLELLPAGASVGSPTKEVKMVRDKINLDEARAKSEVVEYFEDGRRLKMGIITVPDFYVDGEEMREKPEDYRSTTNDVKKLLEELETENVDGVMLDLRNNGGGALIEAISLTGLFIPEGPVVQVKYPQDRVDVMDDEDQSMFYQGPLNVMINRFSASASEIFAGALQDYKRGVIVGEQTYGKGTVQRVSGLNEFLREQTDEELGLLKFTMAKFYRVTGSSTQHRGVSPDIAYPSAFSAEDFGESSKPSAMPWDKIKATDYKALSYVDESLLAALEARHKERLAQDDTWQEFFFDLEELKKNRERKAISLNYTDRKKEQEMLDERRAARVKIGASLTNAETEQAETRALEDIKDPYLKESIRLLADQILLRKKG